MGGEYGAIVERVGGEATAGGRHGWRGSDPQSAAQENKCFITHYQQFILHRRVTNETNICCA